MVRIDWSSAVVEPGDHGPGSQLRVHVLDADPEWAQRFNDTAKREFHRPGQTTRRWGYTIYHETLSLITVDGLLCDEHGPIRQHLNELAATAEHPTQTRSCTLHRRS